VKVTLHLNAQPGGFRDHAIAIVERGEEQIHEREKIETEDRQ
jgi:hypothetical protein